jgi:hypothetical protein
VSGVIGALVVVAVLLAHPWSGDGGTPAASPSVPVLRPGTTPALTRSVSVDFAVVTDPSTDWDAVDRNLDAAGANAVNLNAGRVEFTAFDWPAHPDAAAEPGTDHLATAAGALVDGPDGTHRAVSLIVDAFVPAWIEADPSIAGVDPQGRRSRHIASASELYDGAVGDRIVDYVAALGERYDPSSIELTELFFSYYTYGTDDLALYRKMTGASDWPRTADGAVDVAHPAISRWRNAVMVHLLDRVRTALDGVRDGAGARIGLTLDVRVDWDDPPAGQPYNGQDYRTLLSGVPGLRLQLWAYVGRPVRPASSVADLTASLAGAGYDMARFIVSVGLWSGASSDDPQRPIRPAVLDVAVRGAATHGVTNVNVTPYSLMTEAHWEVLHAAWGTSAVTESRTGG